MSLVGKKGVSADIFTWIFASVAGVLILVFFARFATQHIRVSETLTERQVVEHLIDELDAFGTSGSSTKRLSFRDDLSLQFQCGSVGVGGFVKDLHRIVYAPPELDGDEILAWTEVWAFPFPITNFYYLTNKKIRTIVVYDDRSVRFLQQHSFPAGMNIQSVHIKNLKLEDLTKQVGGLEKLHLVYLTSVRDITALMRVFTTLTPDVVEVDLDQQTVRSFNQQVDSFYLGEEMLYGVLFAPEQFACLQRKALERLWGVAGLLEQRARLLRGKTLDVTCSDLLSQVSTVYHKMIGLEDRDELYQAMERIDEHDRLLQKNGCVSAY